MTPAEIIVVGAFALVLAAGTRLLYHRHVANLPLTIAGQLAYKHTKDIDIYYLRIVLGHGRMMRTPAVSAVFANQHGAQTTLIVSAPTSGWVIGPLTLIIRDAGQVLRAQGTLHLHASTRDTSKNWYTETVLAHTQFVAGNYAPVITPHRRGIRLQHRVWQTIQEPTT